MSNEFQQKLQQAIARSIAEQRREQDRLQQEGLQRQYLADQTIKAEQARLSLQRQEELARGAQILEEMQRKIEELEIIERVYDIIHGPFEGKGQVEVSSKLEGINGAIEPSINVDLVFEYPYVRKETFQTDEGPDWSAPYEIRGSIISTETREYLEQKKDQLISVKIEQVGSPESAKVTLESFLFRVAQFPLYAPETKENIEQSLIKIVVGRTEKGKLPKMLEAEGKRYLRDHPGIRFRRLFKKS